MRFKTRDSIIVGLALLLGGLLAACGPTAAVSLTLSSSSATVLRGQAVSVDVTLTRSGGASADVLLSLDPAAPAGVTASFSPSTLTGSITTSTLALDVDPSAVAGPVTLTVSADGSGLAASQTFTLTIESLTLNGSVVSLLDVPVPNVTVSSQGFSAVTGTDGSFMLTGLSVPYDLMLTSTTDQWAHVFEGMTGADPVLTSIAAGAMGPPTMARTATLTGTLTGGVLPLPAGNQLVVCAEGTSFPVYGGCDRLSSGDSSYNLTAQWNAVGSAPVRVHAVEYAVNGSNMPTSYIGYATASTTLIDGGTLNQDITLGPAPTTTVLTGTVTASSGVTATSGVASLRVSPNLSIAIAQFDPTAPTSILMPDLSGTSFDVFATGTPTGGYLSLAWAAAVTGSTFALTLPSVPVLSTPAPGSTGVTTSTQFKADNQAGSLLTFAWVPTGTGPSFAVTTAGDTATIPDVPGLALPSAADYGVQLIRSDGYANVDEGSHAWLDDYARAMMSLTNAGPGPSRAGGIAAGAPTTTITTAP